MKRRKWTRHMKSLIAVGALFLTLLPGSPVFSDGVRAEFFGDDKVRAEFFDDKLRANVERLLPLAELGDPRAQHDLGFQYVIA